MTKNIKENRNLIINTIEILLYCVPVLSAVWLVSQFGVNVPFMDQWGLVGFYQKVATGEVDFQDFFRQHNEHRLLFSKLIFIIFSFLTNWNIKLEMYFSIVLVVATFVLIYWISQTNSSRDRILFKVLNLTVCLFLFSWVQLANWLFGIQLMWFLISLCVVGAIFCLHVLEIRVSLRILLSAILCAIASFSSAHGVLSWIALIPSVIKLPGTRKQMQWRLALWLGLFLLVGCIYSIGYRSISSHPTVDFILQEPITSLRYFLTLFYSPLRGFDLSESLGREIVGGIVVIGFLLANFYDIKHDRSEIASRLSPWISLAWYAIILGGVITVGRAGFGVDSALASRYVNFMTLAIVALLQILYLLASQPSYWKGYVSRFAVGTLAVVLSINVISGSFQMLPFARWVFLHRQSSKTCVEVIRYLDPTIERFQDNCISTLFPDFKILKKKALILDRIGFREIPDDLEFRSNPDREYGKLNYLSKDSTPLQLSEGETLLLYGWALLPEQQERPHTVLFTYSDRPRFFANAPINQDKPEIAKKQHAKTSQIGWQLEVSPKRLPERTTKIKAWVYNRDKQAFFQLKGEVKLEVLSTEDVNP